MGKENIVPIKSLEAHTPDSWANSIFGIAAKIAAGHPDLKENKEVELKTTLKIKPSEKSDGGHAIHDREAGYSGCFVFELLIEDTVRQQSYSIFVTVCRDDWHT